MSASISLLALPTNSIFSRFFTRFGFVLDLMRCCGRAMCPFMVAVDAGRYLRTASDVKPGHDKN
jgi:hypothetical protein